MSLGGVCFHEVHTEPRALKCDQHSGELWHNTLLAIKGVHPLDACSNTCHKWQCCYACLGTLWLAGADINACSLS